MQRESMSEFPTMNTTPSRLLVAIVSFFIVALLLVLPIAAQDATPAAVNDPCLAGAGAWTPWPDDALGPDADVDGRDDAANAAREPIGAWGRCLA